MCLLQFHLANVQTFQGSRRMPGDQGTALQGLPGMQVFRDRWLCALAAKIAIQGSKDTGLEESPAMEEQRKNKAMQGCKYAVIQVPRFSTGMQRDTEIGLQEDGKMQAYAH